MSAYHVKVEFDDGWYVGRILERPGITTQGRTLDELVFMLRDAIRLMWKEEKVGLELLLPGAVVRGSARRAVKRKAA